MSVTIGEVEFYEKGLTAWIHDVEAIGLPPGFKVIGALSAVLEMAYLDSQVIVHSPTNPGSPFYIPTGSLQASGFMDSEFTGEEWKGVVGYGGPAPGKKNDPVEYAQYERKRGGEHDFMRNMPHFDEMFLEAVASHYGGAA